ncbi:MAG TPA: BatA and WFA domain-containing protein [Chthonomonadaceae bacterium]|nr:BatA and WFA domain-containing protein [Chthonomonadaceae bacterium]
MTFLNAGYWPWLLALGIPVVIHLLTRRTRRLVFLPTYRFLRRSLAQQSQIFLLRRWLLLALRLMLLLFLVLAFLKPTLTAPLAAGQGAHRAVVIVLDTSLSMGYTAGGVSSLARARGQAAALLDDLRPGDAANVILAGAAPQAVLPKPGGDFGTLRQAIKSAQPTPERGDMPAAIAAAAQQLGDTRSAHKELILASDFQRTNWADVRFDALPADVNLVFLRAAPEDRENAALLDLSLRPAAPRVGEEASVEAEVWNGASVTRSLPVTLSWQRDDAPGGASESQMQTVSAPPDASGAVSFPITFPEAGRYRITARLPADNLPADDTRYLVADLRHSLTVVLLTDERLSGSSGAYFLARALNPTPEVPGGVRVLPRHAAALTDVDLKTCDAVLMDDLTTLPADQLPRLYRYVTDGGALIVFLTGPRVIAQMQALAHLAQNGEGLAFLPQTPLDVRRTGKGYLTWTEARYDSPLLKLFKDPQAGDLGKIHFTRLFLTTEPDPRAEILLRYEDGTPAAARRNLGAGSVLLCNFSPSPADSDLARQEVFPPLMHEFLKGMTAKQGERRAFTPGGPASAPLDVVPSGAVQAFGPDGEPEKVTVDRTSGGAILDRVETPGFHTIASNGQTLATLAVNPHPDESDLRPIDPRELENKQGSRASYVVGATGSATAALDTLRHPRPLWPYCLLAAFVALLLEQAVATFGSQVRTRTPTERSRAAG